MSKSNQSFSRTNAFSVNQIQKRPDITKFSSQSLIQISGVDPLGHEIRSVRDERVPPSLTSHLLLPSPPRDFFSGVPEPPTETISPNDRSGYRSYLQNLRDLIEGGSNNHLPPVITA